MEDERKALKIWPLLYLKCVTTTPEPYLTLCTRTVEIIFTAASTKSTVPA